MRLSCLRLLWFGFLCSVLWMLDGMAQAEDHDPEIQLLLPGVKLSLLAEHPNVVTPTGIDVDDDGNVWVVASHTHHRPNEYEGPEKDEILIFDRKGNRRVFYNVTYHTMDLELADDGWVYLIERSRVLRVKDSDGDGQGDTEEVLLELETKSDYPHNGLAGMSWLPSGEFLFGLGENFAESWTLTGSDGVVIRGAGEGGMFSCQADGSKVRRVARGLWNPFGCCVREDGEIFVVDNDPGARPPCRLLHLVEGGDYGYQHEYGPGSVHPFVCWNGELRGTLPMIHPSGEAPCGAAPLGRGLLVPSWSDHRIYFYSLSPKGASFDAKQFDLVSGSRYFRPTCIARDGATSNAKTQVWYLADWVDGRYPVHGYGRVWKLEIDLEKASWLGPLDLQPPSEALRFANNLRLGKHHLSFQELLKTSQNDDPFMAQSALVALARKANEWKISQVQELSAKDRVQAVVALRMADNQDGSTLSAEPWIEAMLADADQEVQYETLRWIAQSKLVQFLPAVEQILDRNDLNYRLFESSVATWNILSGQPEIGIRNVEMLLKRVSNSSSTPSLRAYALRMLPSQAENVTDEAFSAARKFPEGLTLELLEELLTVGDAELSLEAIRALAANASVGEALLASIAADSNRLVKERAEAIVGLAAVAESQLELLLELVADEQKAIREEALRALRGANLSDSQQEDLRKVAAAYADSADLVSAVLQPKLLTEDRPMLTDKAAWLKAISSVPGEADIESGRRIFHHPRLVKCAGCHRHGGRGNVVGPDLSRVGAKRDPSWLLESILQPSLEMGPEYRPTVITTDDGQSYTGIRLQSATFEALRDSNGQRRVIQRDIIESIHELEQSFMPDGLVYLLTDRELRDLLVFLSVTPVE